MHWVYKFYRAAFAGPTLILATGIACFAVVGTVVSQIPEKTSSDWHENVNLNQCSIDRQSLGSVTVTCKVETDGKG